MSERSELNPGAADLDSRAALAPLFTPQAIGRRVLRNRFVMPGMQRGWTHEGAPTDDLAGYYRRRADQVDALVADLTGVTPPAETADGWTDALAGLSRYAQWARSIADTVEADGLKTDQTPDPGLENFRTVMLYGACHVLLDVN